VASTSNRTARCSICIPTCRQRGSAGLADCTVGTALADCRGCLAGDHREQHRSVRLSAAGDRSRLQWHHDSGDSHRRRRTHGAGRYLALAARTRPRLTIDYATLTGACVYALTERYSGVFTNRERLAQRLQDAGSASGERVWNFPLDEDFDTDLESGNADIVQCAVEGKGDHILAARFLKRFIGDENPWVHVDLSSATRRGGLAHVGTDVTGFGVRFTLELLLSQRLYASANT
jgi:hypothetical protein